MSDAWSLVRAERESILALLESLEPGQWDEQSLCSEWRVRDVVGHIVGTTELRFSPTLVGQFFRNGFNVNRMIARDGVRRGRATPEELKAELEVAIPNENLPPGVKGPTTMLIDALLHHQDIRRPLGLPREIPEERLSVALDTLVGFRSPALDPRSVAAGLRLVATDVSWSAGDGPEVRGPGEALAGIMGGRPAGLADVEGEGKPALAARLAR